MQVERVGWGSVRDDLASTFDGDEAEIYKDVKTGAASCWRIGNTAMISRREGAELVVMCLAGSDLRESAPVIKAAAARAGCQSIRMHTKRKGLVKLLAPVGVSIDEYILRVALDGQ
jgi:hypothetical protein